MNFDGTPNCTRDLLDHPQLRPLVLGTCLTCRWHRRDYVYGSEGTCQRYAPRVGKVKERSADSRAHAQFPVTQVADGCGEWEDDCEVVNGQT